MEPKIIAMFVLIAAIEAMAVYAAARTRSAATQQK